MESNKPFVKSPAFQVYPSDFLADANTLVMSTIEIGAYWLLLLTCWKENGLRDNVDDLARIARLSVKQFQPLWDRHIERCFTKREDGKWTHKRLEREREKQAKNRQKRQAAGAKGAKARWQSDSNAIAMPFNGNGNANATAMANDSLSVFSLQTSVNTSASAETKPKHRDELFESLASLCRVNIRLCTKDQRGALNQTAKILRDAGHTAADVFRVGEWWYRHDWRSKKGQPPKPSEIREVWDQSFNTPPSRDPDEHPNSYRPGKMVY